jgi:hypothetical protein
LDHLLSEYHTVIDLLSRRYWNALYICQDCNFKMKGRGDKGEPDHSLRSGCAYFVEDEPYAREIANPAHMSNQPVSVTVV